MELVIRRANRDDIKNIAVLKQQVWISTYATEGLREEFSGYVLSKFSKENVEKSLLSQSKLTLVAIVADHMVGCAEISLRPQSPILSVEPCLEITVLYVLERFQGLGIGVKLIDEAIKIVKEMNCEKVWLTVYFGNEKAIRFYKKHNFKPIGDTNFVLGENKYKNLIMLKDI